ncbi:MAG: DUF2058 domain-containing protein [Steroidobacteraceae bacterium]
MSMSLREQLLKAGLVTEKQARQAEKQQYQGSKQKVSKKAPPRELTPAAKQAQAAKAARDQELNRRQQEKAAAKARVAQLKQLVEQHRVPRVESDDWYNFVVDGKIRRIPVDAALRERLVRGELAVVRCDGHYDLVPVPLLDRIRERDPAAVVHLVDRQQQAGTVGASGAAVTAAAAADDDPYKDFVVPDDLTW